MKRIYHIFTAAICSSLLLASCQKDEPEGGKHEGDGDKQEQIGESVSVEISAAGEWTDADVLGLSIPSTQEYNKAASFENGKFRAEIATPAQGAVLYAYLPYNPTAADGSFTINLPASVAGNDGSVKAKVASPMALGEITDPLPLSLTMTDVTGTICFNLTDITGGTLAGHTVTSVTVNSETAIAGYAAVSMTSAEATLSEGTTTVTITPEEGTVLSSEAVTLKISALPGTYSGKVLVATSATEYEFPLNAVVTAGESTDVALECTEAQYKGIENAEDWNSFVAGIIAGSYNRFVNPETGAVELAASFTSEETLAYPGTTENASIEFDGVFDGKGFEITCNQFTRPLFNFLGTNAVVKNLTVRGTFTQMLNAGLCGNAVIAKVNKGTIENVTSYVTTDLTLESGIIFGAICGQNGGTLKNCKNYGNITLNYAATGASGLYGGGLAAIGHTTSGDPAATHLNVDETCTPGQFIDCENHGDITITAIAGSPVRQGFGGICGLVYLNGVKFDGCKNTGDISRISNGENSNRLSASVGGILGRSAAWYTIGTGDSGAFDNGYDGSGATLGSYTGNGYDTEYTDCTNEGDLFCQARHNGGVIANQHTRRSDNVGGIAGLAIGADGKIQKFSGCSNTGKLHGGWSADVNTLIFGGITAYACFTEISGCSSICEMKCTDNTKSVGAAGGLVGYAMSDVEIKGDCVSVPAMDIYGKPGSTNFLYGLVIGNIHTSATVSSVSVGGSIKAGGTDLGITSENYTGYLVSAASGAALTSPVTTWYTAQ